VLSVVREPQVTKVTWVSGRGWRVVVPREEPGETMLPVVLAPLLVLLAGNGIGSWLYGPTIGLVIGFGGAAALFVLLFFTVPLARRTLRARRSSGAGEVRSLASPAGRSAFDQAVAAADRISETWPELGDLVDEPAAEEMLAEALWEVSGLLARREELESVLGGLSRPEFAAAPLDDPTAHDLAAQLRATKEALSAIEIELAARLTSLRNAEEAGRAVTRERQMRDAIRAAERSLSTASDASTPPVDPAAVLAERTEAVLVAYRELTASLGGTAPVPGRTAPGSATPAPGSATPAPGSAAPAPGSAAPTPGSAAPTPGSAAPGSAAPAPAPHGRGGASSGRVSGG
jgi:hypothetical protein